MKCKDCDSCIAIYYRGEHQYYQCIGVKEPFQIDNIEQECTEYKEKQENREVDIMIDMPNCEDCIHEEVCKLKKETSDYREILVNSIRECEEPKGISININCNYFSNFNQVEFERSSRSC